MTNSLRFYTRFAVGVYIVNGKNPAPFVVFVTGGAGTGKSHLTKAIQYEVNRLLSKMSDNPDDLHVLLTAPTGVVVFNINAETIHNSLAIGTDVSLPYQPLGEDKVNNLRAKLGKLQLLITDEISMDDHKLLTYIHGMVRQRVKCQSATSSTAFTQIDYLSMVALI